MKFRTKSTEMKIRVLSAMAVVWLVKPMTATEERELERGFEEFDPRTRSYRTKDYIAIIKAKAVRVIRGWEGMEGEDGPLEYSTATLEALCENHPDIISEVLSEAKSVDAVRVEDAEKN